MLLRIDCRCLIYKVTTCAALSLLAYAVQSQTIPPSSTVEVQQSKPDKVTPYVDKLIQYANEATLYKAMTKKLEAQLQTMTKQAEVEKSYPLASRPKGPVLVAVEGLNDRLHVLIELSPGVPIQAKVDDILPNGMQVTGISFDSVTLLHLKTRKQAVLVIPQTPYSTSVGYFELDSSLASTPVKVYKHSTSKIK